MMVSRAKGRAACAAVLLLAACRGAAGSSAEAEQVPLARLVPAVAPNDVERGRCDLSRRMPVGAGLVEMSFPADDPISSISALFHPDGGLISYSEIRQGKAATTGIFINVRKGTAELANSPHDDAPGVVGRGTAAEALRSEVLGTPSRRIERVLARCGRPGETNGKS